MYTDASKVDIVQYSSRQIIVQSSLVQFTVHGSIFSCGQGLQEMQKQRYGTCSEGAYILLGEDKLQIVVMLYETVVNAKLVLVLLLG